MYLSEFPLVLYKGSNQELVILSDLTKAFSVTGSLQSKEIITYSIKDGDTAESLSYKISNTASNSWIILLMNRIQDINYDWPMDSNTFDHYIQKKYGDKICLFLETINVYGTFKPNDNIEIIDENGNVLDSAMVVEWDRTYSKLVLKNYGNKFQEINEFLKLGINRYFVRVNDQNIARVGRIVLSNSQALHHFENENKIYLDPHSGLLDSYSLFFSNEFVVTNYQFELEQNDSKRKIILPTRKLIQKIRKDLKDKKLIQ
jgi:hypothetical protein